jgi:methylmalonyl-CoA mutase C-terminal domain/subunit
MTVVPRVVELLEANGAGDVLVTVGGTIPSDDISALKRAGVAAVFTPGTTTDAIVSFLRANVAV